MTWNPRVGLVQMYSNGKTNYSLAHVRGFTFALREIHFEVGWSWKASSVKLVLGG